MTSYRARASRYADPNYPRRHFETAVDAQEAREALGVTGLAAELHKKDGEAKAMHLMLTDAGIPATSSGSGEGICLMGRLAILVDRYEALKEDADG